MEGSTDMDGYLKKYISNQIVEASLIEVCSDLQMLDDKDSKYYNKPGNIYFVHD